MPRHRTAPVQHRRSMLAPVAALSLAVSAAAWSPAAAQERQATGLVGVVRGEDGFPIAGAEVRVIGGPHSGSPSGGWVVRADSAGAYRVPGLRPGSVFLRVRRLGYAPVQTSLTIADGELREVPVVLTALPTQLASVEVRANSGLAAVDELRLRDFSRRRRQGGGVFLSRDDLARRFSGAGDVATVVRALGGIRGCQLQGNGADQVTGAPARLVVNGNFWRPAPGYGYLPVDEVDAIEVYNAGRLPPSWEVSMGPEVGGTSNAAFAPGNNTVSGARRSGPGGAPNWGAIESRIAGGSGSQFTARSARAEGCLVVLWTAA